MATRGADRLFAKLHEKTKPDRFGMLPTDGSIVWASPIDLDPDNENDFLGLSARQFDGPGASGSESDDA